MRLGFLSLGLLLISSSASAESESGFTKQEKTLLDQGQIVVRKSTRRIGKLRMFGGTSWQVINAPPQVVWKALQDVRQYPSMIPRLKAVNIISRKKQRTTVAFHHQGGPFTVDYALKMERNDKRKLLSFRLDPDQPSNLVASWGYFAVRAYPKKAGQKNGQSRTLLNYGVMADIGSGGIKSFVRPMLHDQIFVVSKTIKRYSEREGIARYGSKKAKRKLKQLTLLRKGLRKTAGHRS